MFSAIAFLKASDFSARSVRFSRPFWSILALNCMVNDCCFMFTSLPIRFLQNFFRHKVTVPLSLMMWIASGEGFSGLGWVLKIIHAEL